MRYGIIYSTPISANMIKACITRSAFNLSTSFRRMNCVKVTHLIGMQNHRRSHRHHHRLPTHNKKFRRRRPIHRCQPPDCIYLVVLIMLSISYVTSATSWSLAFLSSKTRRQSVLPHAIMTSPCTSWFHRSHTRATTPKVISCLNADTRGGRNPSHGRKSQQARIQRSDNRSHSSTPKIQLDKPQVIFSNNHLLVVNKPPGWKSQPGNGGGQPNDNSNNSQYKSEYNNDPKCLLSYLQSQSLGGGSMKDFLMPTHRLDQPCTGVLIFAKNGKAASRVQVAWSKRQVKKCYWVVVEGGGIDKNRGGGSMNGLELLQSRSSHILDPETGGNTHTYQLSAILKNTGGKDRDEKGGRQKNAGGSVVVKPLPPDQSSPSADDGRVCHIEWKHLLSLRTKSSASTRHLLSVTTDTGAKHQVRALLALAGGAPIAGDLRYGNNNLNSQSKYQPGRVDQPLPDGSVALHARSVFLPTVSLGGMEFLKDEPFVASIPRQWKDFFGIREEDFKKF